ncbi:HAD family phosphatase [Candidatus Saccharibacteria bacterium]|nr:MAG: HAD family phosphatase [Candidatus Saccharibacteria bacterium]
MSKQCHEADTSEVHASSSWLFSSTTTNEVFQRHGERRITGAKRAKDEITSGVGGSADKQASRHELRKFAVFDIDGTLIRWQLYHAVVHKLGKVGQLGPGDFEAINAARMEWKNRHDTEGFHIYENEVVERLKTALPHIDPAVYDQVAEEVFDEYKDQTFTYTRNLVTELKTKGYLLFAISGSPQEVIELLAKHHGFDDAISGTFERLNGQFTGKYATPIFNKKSALDSLIEKHGATYDESYAVGDSASDISLLEAVTHPIAFSPDQNLYRAAKKRNWPIIVERKNVVYEL